MGSLESKISDNRFFLGIDESNHGLYPEIFVAVLSKHISDIEYNDKILGKIRNARYDIKTSLADRSFYYFALTEKIANGRNNESIKVAVFSEMINYFKNIDTVRIDGELNTDTLERIKRRLCYNPTIIAERKADIHYPLVNFADNIAYFLYNHSINAKDSEKIAEYESHKLKIHNKVRRFQEKL